MSTQTVGHTPGPWRFEADDISEVLIPVQRFSVLAPWSEKVRPGTAYGFGSYRGIHICAAEHNGTPESREQAEANARLIAAAPEMLEMLRALAYVAEDYAGTDTDMPSHEDVSERFDITLAQAKAVIAKAEGRSE